MIYSSRDCVYTALENDEYRTQNYLHNFHPNYLSPSLSVVYVSEMKTPSFAIYDSSSIRRATIGRARGRSGGYVDGATWEYIISSRWERMMGEYFRWLSYIGENDIQRDEFASREWTLTDEESSGHISCESFSCSLWNKVIRARTRICCVSFFTSTWAARWTFVTQKNGYWPWIGL